MPLVLLGVVGELEVELPRLEHDAADDRSSVVAHERVLAAEAGDVALSLPVLEAFAPVLGRCSRGELADHDRSVRRHLPSFGPFLDSDGRDLGPWWRPGTSNTRLMEGRWWDGWPSPTARDGGRR